MLCWWVAPDGGTQWQAGHKGATEKSKHCAPLRSLEDSRPKTGEGLVCFAPPNQKPCQLMTTVWQMARHDYLRATLKDAFCLDISTRTMSGVQRMTPQLKPAPPARDALHAAQGLRHIGGVVVQRNKGKRGRGTRHPPSFQWADPSLRRCYPTTGHLLLRRKRNGWG